MDIEYEIFKKSDLIEEKLIPYGFKKKNNEYFYSKNILDDTFQVEIKIEKNGKIKGEIIEIALEEEYINYRLDNIQSSFASKIKEEYEKILIDIKNNCFDEKYFIYEQTNRICDFIIKKYGDKPYFAWEKFPNFGIFKNSKNEKWYGLIMNIDSKKIKENFGEVEIINLKSDKVEVLLKEKGYYAAYHMNKKKWVSIILNDTLDDKEIKDCIVESYNLVKN